MLHHPFYAWCRHKCKNSPPAVRWIRAGIELLVCLLLFALLVFLLFEMLHQWSFLLKCFTSDPSFELLHQWSFFLKCFTSDPSFEMLHQWSFFLKCFTSDPCFGIASPVILPFEMFHQWSFFWNASPVILIFEMLHQWSFFLKSFTSDPSFEMLHQWSFFLKCFTSDPSFWSAMPLYFLPLSKAVSIGFQTVSCFAWLMVTFTAVIGACT